MYHDFTLMHLMCAKICHDLAAPVSAIAMGLEMFQDEKAKSGSATHSLVAYSARSATAKIEVFRCLTGFSSEPDKPIVEDIVRALENYWEDGKIKLHWPMGEYNRIKGSSARLLLAVLLTAADGIYHGGILTVNANSSITAQGRVARLREDNIAALTGQPLISNQTSRTIIPYFAFLLAQKLGGKLTIECERDDQFLIRLLDF